MNISSSYRWMVLTVALALGCSGSGFGDSVKQDIDTQMRAARAQFQKCYAEALKRDRELKGSMTVSIKAAPETGKFEQVQAQSATMKDAALSECVENQAKKLALSAPQKTAVAADYPLDFAPAN